LLLSHDFDPARLPLAFAFRKAGMMPRAASAPMKTEWAPTVRPAPRSTPRPVARPLPFQTVKSAATAKPVPDPDQAAAGLDAVAALADQGHFVEAARQGEEHLRVHGPSARGYYLLGLVRDAAGNHGAAMEYYRKALYLEPKHLEALMQLAYLLEKQGDRSGAKVMNERVRRIGQETTV
jgi:chemotaxis protein methyltransferase WspC